ncbi:MAG: DUF1127 domain-containing protein [Methylobacterium mesophilicum]|nr:DUF1127 domain-containing protein [Methylobacterium mesophilicum]
MAVMEWNNRQAGVFSQLRDLVFFLNNRLHRDRTLYKHLMELSDERLRDIGLERNDIASLVDHEQSALRGRGFNPQL